MEVFYREAKPVANPKLEILLLHGQAFTSENWVQLGTLNYLAAMGHRAIAIDIPGERKRERVRERERERGGGVFMYMYL